MLREEFHVALKLRGLFVEVDIVHPYEDVLLWVWGFCGG